MPAAIPVIDGWFTLEDPPHLIGRRCPVCGTYQFPPTGDWCPNPRCDSEDMEAVPLSRTGRVWSYTDAQYQPPPPYVSASDPFVPFAIAAVELAVERIVILGQVAAGFGVGDLQVGAPVELVVEPLDQVDDQTKLVWRWRPLGSATSEGEG
jgi:uncharacterized OB-fold protein